jgi:hypothetical protein
MARLIPLSEIPHSGREAEAAARREYDTREQALEAAAHEIVAAPGTHGKPYPPTYGWVLTRAAARSLVSQVVHMPGGTSHRHFSCYSISDAGGSA